MPNLRDANHLPDGEPNGEKTLLNPRIFNKIINYFPAFLLGDVSGEVV
jgi:hypothetical protein